MSRVKQSMTSRHCSAGLSAPGRTQNPAHERCLLGCMRALDSHEAKRAVPEASKKLPGLSSMVYAFPSGVCVGVTPFEHAAGDDKSMTSEKSVSLTLKPAPRGRPFLHDQIIS